MLRLVATDMDGTLLDSKKQLPRDFIPWVKAHPDIKTVIASGRQYYTLAKDFQPVKDQVIFACENGGLVYDHGEVIYRNVMRKQDLRDCLARIRQVPAATPILCGEAGAFVVSDGNRELLDNAKLYYEKLNRVGDLLPLIDTMDFVKIAIFFSGHRAEENYPFLKEEGPDIAVLLSGDDWLDMQNRTVNKGVAIQEVQKKYGISPAECLAFGDYLNDTEMLQVCGESYCMKNGHGALKKTAKYVTEYTNDEDGVMRVLRERIPDKS